MREDEGYAYMYDVGHQEAVDGLKLELRRLLAETRAMKVLGPRGGIKIAYDIQ